MKFENEPQNNEVNGNQFERASKNIQRVIEMNYKNKSAEEQEKLAEIIATRLEELKGSEELKLVISGGLRTLEPQNSETPGEGLNMADASILFGLEHTYESLSAEEPELKEDLEKVFGKTVEVVSLDNLQEAA